MDFVNLNATICNMRIVKNLKMDAIIAIRTVFRCCIFSEGIAY